jgi:hypothetical protein
VANLTTTFDCKQAALKHCGELTDGTSYYEDRMLDYLNRVYTEIISGGSTFVPDLCEPWAWARAPQPGLLTLLPPFDSGLGGSVSVTNASTSGSFAIAPPVALGSFVGRFLHLDSRPDVYRIAAHTPGASSFTLDQPYQQGTIAGSGFSCHKLDYPLVSSVVRLVEPFRVFARQLYYGDGEGKIQGLSTDELHRRFPLYTLFSLSNRTPTHFAIVSEVGGVITVRFNASPVENARVEYEYVPLPSDLSISATPATDPLPLIPPEHRSILAYGAAYWLLVDKEDPRQDLFMRMAQAKIQAMLLERRREFEDETRDFARLIPRRDQYFRPYVRSTSGVRYP